MLDLYARRTELIVDGVLPFSDSKCLCSLFAARQWHHHWHADRCSRDTCEENERDELWEAVDSEGVVLSPMRGVGSLIESQPRRRWIRTHLLFFMVRPTWTTQTSPRKTWHLANSHQDVGWFFAIVDCDSIKKVLLVGLLV